MIANSSRTGVYFDNCEIMSTSRILPVHPVEMNYQNKFQTAAVEWLPPGKPMPLPPALAKDFQGTWDGPNNTMPMRQMPLHAHPARPQQQRGRRQQQGLPVVLLEQHRYAPASSASHIIRDDDDDDSTDGDAAVKNGPSSSSSSSSSTQSTSSSAQNNGTESASSTRRRGHQDASASESDDASVDDADADARRRSSSPSLRSISPEAHLGLAMTKAFSASSSKLCGKRARGGDEDFETDEQQRHGGERASSRIAKQTSLRQSKRASIDAAAVVLTSLRKPSCITSS